MMQQDRLRSLDSLRGIGALCVVIYHATSVAFGGVNRPGIALVPHRGYLAVDLFFLLSGFVLAHVYGAEFSSRPSLKRGAAFLWARIARLYPVHLLCILLLLRLYGETSLYSGRALALNLLLLQGPWLPHTTWNQPSWSISAEWHAYLLFPLLCPALWRFSVKVAVAVALACALALLLTGAESGWSFVDVTAGPLILTRALPEFIAGVLVYRVHRCGWGRSLWRSDLFLAATVVAIFALACGWPTDLAIVLLFPGLLLAAVTNEGRARSLFDSRPLTFLGDISYSLYMSHYVCIVVVFGKIVGADAGSAAITAKIAAFCAAIGLSLLFATLVSRCIEYPARAKLRALWPGATKAPRPVGSSAS
jgi:peptidoglycan/LPS O-acetylase OafA/YrhL